MGRAAQSQAAARGRAGAARVGLLSIRADAPRCGRGAVRAEEPGRAGRGADGAGSRADERGRAGVDEAGGQGGAGGLAAGQREPGRFCGSIDCWVRGMPARARRAEGALRSGCGRRSAAAVVADVLGPVGRAVSQPRSGRQAVAAIRRGSRWRVAVNIEVSFSNCTSY